MSTSETDSADFWGELRRYFEKISVCDDGQILLAVRLYSAEVVWARFDPQTIEDLRRSWKELPLKRFRELLGTFDSIVATEVANLFHQGIWSEMHEDMYVVEYDT
jgi:hypothetical protein